MTSTATDAAPAASDQPPDPVTQWLSEAATVVRPGLRRALDALHPDLARLAYYHKGWADRDGNPVTGGSSGKGVRPALALWAAQVVGIDDAHGMAAATAVELVHDFSLVHDDIMDGDRVRRGRPTVWAAHGTGPAVLLGDALVAAAHLMLVEAGPRGPAASATLAQRVGELCHGQAADLEFETRAEVSVQEYLTMVEGKTAALMRAATTLPAALAAKPPPAAAEFDRLGHHIGVLFQVVDDLLGLFGDPTVTGKPVGSDLARGKKTLPILAALAAPGPAAAELRTLLERGELDDDDVTRGTELVLDARGDRRTREECAWQHRHALAALRRLTLDEEARAPVEHLLTHLLDRTA